jgi:putative DNA primase/helicase
MTDLAAVFGQYEQSNCTPSDPINVILDRTLGQLNGDSDNDTLARAIADLGEQARTLPPVQREVARRAAADFLKLLGVVDGRRMVDAALRDGTHKPETTAETLSFADPKPWDEPVAIDEVLEQLVHWIRRYVFLTDHAAHAVALWVVITWFVGEVYIAPILCIISATKRCGKTVLLDLLSRVTRRGYMTSGTGITAAVLFRLNEKHRPTFHIDEAEKLAGRHSDKDLVAMVNVGYRRGGKVQRCADRGGQYDVEEYDAFGFRALASTRVLWDTVTDRSIVVQLQRKPQSASLKRFFGRVVDTEGAELARKLRRATEDVRERFGVHEEAAPRPVWLHDRAADNWAPPLAVAAMAGGEWPKRALVAARALQPDADDEQDHGERLIQDVRQIFDDMHQPEVIKSGELVERLNRIETAPWGDYRDGKGITTHKLASLTKRFGVKPGSRRASDGAQTRGYWQFDLEPVFERYPRNTETVETLETVWAEREGIYTDDSSGVSSSEEDKYEKDERLGIQEYM